MLPLRFFFSMILVFSFFFLLVMSSRRSEGEIKDFAAARKVQRADREKLRRDRLNEQFIELGNALGDVKMLLFV